MLIVHPHFHPRRTGVTSHVEAIVRALSAHVDTRVVGGSVVEDLPRISLRDLRYRAKTGPVVWHAHRNNELLVGLVLRLFTKGLRVVFTRHAARKSGLYTRLLARFADARIALTEEVRDGLGLPAQIVGHGVDVGRFSKGAMPHPLGAGRGPADSKLLSPPNDRTAPLDSAAPRNDSHDGNDRTTRPTGDSAPDFRNRPRGEREREHLGWPQKRLVGVVGRIREEKGQGDFVLAAAPLLAGRADWAAVLVGRTAPSDEAFRQTLVKQGGPALHFAGELRDPGPAYRALDIVVIPSRSEGFSLVLLEAMASGACVVAASLPHFPQFIDDGRTGFLYPPGDVAALRALLQSLVDDPARVEAAGHQAIREAQARFDISHEAASLLAIYRQVFGVRG